MTIWSSVSSARRCRRPAYRSAYRAWPPHLRCAGCWRERPISDRSSSWCSTAISLARYQAMVSELRAAGVRAELYLGQSGMRAQLKYADKRAAPIVVIEGGDERAKGEVTLKDMALGAELSGEIKSRAEWAKGAASQVAVKREDLARRVCEILARHPA